MQLLQARQDAAAVTARDGGVDAGFTVKEVDGTAAGIPHVRAFEYSSASS